MKEFTPQKERHHSSRTPSGSARIKRRSFFKTSLAAGAALAFPDSLIGSAVQTPSGSSSPIDTAATLPWKREIPLRQAAQSVFFENVLNPKNPLPDSGEYFTGPSMSINNLKMRTTMWGTPDRITVSLNKNNVWDRRLNARSLSAPTLREIIEGAYAPANADYVGIDTNSDTLRPKGYGYLLKEGGYYDPYRQPYEYPFPCMKPVGQIILGMDPLAGATAPRVTQSCATGLVKLQVAKDAAKASLEYVLGMTSNIYAIRGDFAGINTPVWLRLYRHRDTAHMGYMSADGKTYTRRGTEADSAFNGPMAPPASGTDGRYFWIRQKFPAEKTFPDGFEYVLMGVVATPGRVKLDSVENQTGLGTPPPDRRIAAAPGAAATATFTPDADGKLEAFVTIVTTMDGADLLALAKARLVDAEADGFDGVVWENTQWWNHFYDQRENGRVFHGTSGSDCSDDVRAIYRSYADSHGGGTKTNMRHLECSASYAFPERDVQLWNSEPCYNEIFTTSRFVRNWSDSEDMWKEIVWHWKAAAEENARAVFDMPGMCIVHGYLPPVKADKYVHTTLTLEFCLGTMAQIIRPSWDEWDYGGDINVLRNQCYPLMREMAMFYAAYAKKGEDGYYHIIPSMAEERWGWYPRFARNKDVVSSLCMFRWALTRAADAAELLEEDADLRDRWREVAARIVPNPTWKTPEGLECAEQPNLEPRRLPGDHFAEPAMYPALLADEINLDSPQEQKDMMRRTVRALRAAATSGATLLLLGVSPDEAGNQRRQNHLDPEMLMNSRSGRIHLFPLAAPTDEIAFHNFQARGGFLVSACKNANGVYHVEIEARRDHQCQLMNPWPGKPVGIHEAGESEPVPFHLDTSNGECVVFSAIAGRKYSVMLQS
jgi:Glycosyl hydrolase family 95 catalytic domain